MKRLVGYTVGMIALAGAAFAVLLLNISDLAPGPSGDVDGAALRVLFVKTIALMFAAGVLGGSLYNLRGLVKHSQEDDFKESYMLSYYLRPVSGGVSGVIVFFLLLGGALTLNIGTGGAEPTWGTLLGRMPYLAFALLAGYSSHEFMLKLKDLAEALFALRKGKDE